MYICLVHRSGLASKPHLEIRYFCLIAGVVPSWVDLFLHLIVFCNKVTKDVPLRIPPMGQGRGQFGTIIFDVSSGCSVALTRINQIL